MDKKNTFVDVILSHIIPILGMFLFVTGLWYLIYTSIWENLNTIVRIMLGFVFAFLMIGWGLAFKEKLWFFKEIIIGGGVLLLYGTIIYGPQTTDPVFQTIPSLTHINIAAIATIGITYLASLEKSLVILIFGILWAYITPMTFIYVSDISLTSYLIYCAFINVTIAVLSREIAIEKILPLNVVGLFVSTHFFINTLMVSNHDTTENAILLSVIAVLSAVILIFSLKNFQKVKLGFWFTLLILSPILWFISLEKTHIFQINFTSTQLFLAQIATYGILAGIFFQGWYWIIRQKFDDYRHSALLAGGIIALIFAIFGTETMWANVAISLAGLGVVSLNFFHEEKTENLVTAMILTNFAWIMSLLYRFADWDFLFFYGTTQLLSLIPFLPAIFLVFIGKMHKNLSESVQKYLTITSLLALLGMLISGIMFMLSFGVLYILFFISFSIITYAFLDKKALNPIIILAIIFLLYAFIFISIRSFDHFYFDSIDIICIILTIVGLNLFMKILNKYNNEKENNLFFLGMQFIAWWSLWCMFFPYNEFMQNVWMIFVALWTIFIGIQKSHRKRELYCGLIILFLYIFLMLTDSFRYMNTTTKIIIFMMIGVALMAFSYFLQKYRLSAQKQSENHEEKPEK